MKGKNWMWVYVAACPAWRVCVSAGEQEGGEDGENAQEKKMVVPFLDVCVHARMRGQHYRCLGKYIHSSLF